MQRRCLLALHLSNFKTIYHFILLKITGDNSFKFRYDIDTAKELIPQLDQLLFYKIKTISSLTYYSLSETVLKLFRAVSGVFMLFGQDLRILLSSKSSAAL